MAKKNQERFTTVQELLNTYLPGHVPPSDNSEAPPSRQIGIADGTALASALLEDVRERMSRSLVKDRQKSNGSRKNKKA